jgi:hypothetical protein
MERLLWGVAAAATGIAIVMLRAGAVDASAGAVPVLPVTLLALPRPTMDSLERAVSDVAERNLFRAERSMADESSAAPAVGMMPAAPSTKPRLVLRGVLGGPPWDALIDGIPGRDGAVVMRAGQVVGGVTIRAVKRDTVFARGFDTTWALTLGRSW